MPSLLLVDTAVAGYQKIVEAARTTVIQFNRYEDTYASLLEKINPALTYETVGIVQHGSATSPIYSLLDKEGYVRIAGIKESVSETTGLINLITFFNTLKSVYGVSIIDLISCSLYSNPDWISAIQTLETKVGINFRASSNATGNLKSGGDWIQESDGVDIRDIYFTDAITEFVNLLYIYKINRQIEPLSASTYDRCMVSAARPVLGMTTLSTPPDASATYWRNTGAFIAAPKSLSGVKSVASIIASTYAAITNSGNVVSWGNSNQSYSVPSGLSSVIAIATTDLAFAALKSDGSVVAWGDSTHGGSVPSGLTNVVAIAASERAFAALKTDGTVVAWGDSSYGGTSPEGLTNVVAIASSPSVFIALKLDKTIYAWGSSSAGATVPEGITNVRAIYPGERSVVALKEDGTLIGWGDSIVGDIPNNLTNVVAVATSYYEYAALKSDNTMVVWGLDWTGAYTYTITNVESILSSYNSLIVLKTTGVVVDYGLKGEVLAEVSNVDTVVTTDGAAAFLKKDGTVVARGDPEYGGSVPIGLSDVVSIKATGSSIAALKSDGSIVAWGDSWTGGYNPSGITNAFAIIPSDSGFAALTTSKPYITVQPISQSVNAGGSVSLSVVAVGSATLTYQWKKGGVAITDATSATLIFSSVSSGDAGSYTVDVSNSLSSLTSQAATLTVLAAVITPPSISTQPSSLNVLDGSSATFSVVATGTSLSYQWRKEGVAISGATSSSLTITAVSASDAGSYTVFVSNTAGSATSTTATLSIVYLPTFTIPLDANQTAIVNARVFFSVAVSGTGHLTYSWSKDGSPLVGSTSIYSVSDVSSIDAGVYTVSVASPYGTITSSCTLTITTNTTIDQATFIKGNIPTNTTVQYSGQTINNTQATYRGSSKIISSNTVSFTSNPTASASSQQSIALSNVPANVERAVIAITAPITQAGKPPAVNVQIKLFDSNNNYISDVSNSPVTVDIKMPSTITASTLNVYRVLDVATNTLELAGTATKQPVSLSTPATTYRLTLPRFSEFIFTEEDLMQNTPIPCFPAGTRVLTADGFKAVEKLGRADKLITAGGRAVNFIRYYSLLRQTTSETAPYLIPANTFGPQQPAADIVLSPLHAFQSRQGVWQIPLVAAKEYPEIRQVHVGSPMLYFHLKLPNYLQDNIVLEGGVVAESFGGREYAHEADIYTYRADLGGFTRKTASEYQSFKSKM
jgi:alpha-tubulin suppressor-like RCC1 family protein